MTRLFITAALCLMLYGCGSSTPSVPAPRPPVHPPAAPVAPGPELYRRKEPLRYGYYGADYDQVPQTSGHTNLLYEVFWGGLDASIQRIREAATYTIIDVAECLFVGGKWNEALKSDAEAQLRDRLNILREQGVLHYVRGITPMDEPNLPAHYCCDIIPEAVALIRRVAADYHELQDVRLVCLYFTERPMCHLALFDDVGFDNYKLGERVLWPGGLADQVLGNLLPHQRLFLVPGGSYKQDPVPFVNFALSEPRVFAVVPFLWVSKVDGHEITGIGAQPGIRQAYSAAGRMLIDLGDRVWQIKRPEPGDDGNFA